MKDHDEIIDLLRTDTGWHNPNYLEELLGALQSFGDEAVSALADALTDPNTDLRILALQVLGHYDGDTESALPAMIRALEDPPPHRSYRRHRASGSIRREGEVSRADSDEMAR